MVTFTSLEYSVLSDVNLLGCHSMDDLFNGSTAARACKPGHVKSWLEERDIIPERYVNEHVENFCMLINLYLDPEVDIPYERIMSLIPTGHRSNRMPIRVLAFKYPNHR